jgi:hypothetical protein
MGTCLYNDEANRRAQTTHRCSNLNDNGDGTFSVVGSHNGKAPRVVSSNPPGPDEPPPIAPRLSPHIEEGRMAERQKSAVALSRGPTSSSVDKPPAPSVTSSGGQDNLWDHISSRAAVQPTDRETPEARILLRYPKTRDLNIVSLYWLAAANPRLVPSLILQVVGVQNPNPCTECRRHDGPFDSCVSAPANLMQQVLPFLGSSAAKACANCIARKNSGRCSVRDQRHSALSKVSRPAEKDLVDADMPELSEDSADDEEAAGAIQARRRPTRLSIPNSERDLDGGDEESDEEAPVEPEPRPSRLVTFKGPNPAQNNRQLRERRSASLKGNAQAPAEGDLHLEDWEMDDGRVNAGGVCMSCIPPPSRPLFRLADIHCPS